MDEVDDIPAVCSSPAPASPVATKKEQDGTEEDSNRCSSYGAKNESPKTKTNNNTCKPTSAAGAPLPMVSTPSRDSATIIAKRMQNLQLHASPQPFTAGSPMRTFNTTPHKHCDLTPVMKNTAPAHASTAVDLDLDLELDFDLDMLDPRGGHEELGNAFSARPRHPGAMLPPLAKRGLFPAPKRSDDHEASKPKQIAAIEIPQDARPPLRAPELAFLPRVEEPVPFPPSGKSLTFTSMKQYERRTQRESPPHTAGLQPYQPSRQDPGLVDIPQEALKSIFTTRRTSSQALSTPESTFSEEDDNNSNAMQGLYPAIPLEERQWSIPSIRLAHQVGGSVTSCTTYTDEDDESLLYRDDDVSLSSYGSYSHLTGADENNLATNIQAIFMTPDPSQVAFDAQQPQQLDDYSYEEGMDTGDDSSLPDAPEQQQQLSSSRYHQLLRRERRKEMRERKALEWLRTVKAGENEVAEAASSKFLTRRNDIIMATPQVLYDKPQKRLSAAAVETRTFGFLAKDLEDVSCGGAGYYDDDDDSLVQTPAVFQQVFGPSNPIL